jgi:hypothetical protein
MTYSHPWTPGVRPWPLSPAEPACQQIRVKPRDAMLLFCASIDPYTNRHLTGRCGPLQLSATRLLALKRPAAAASPGSHARRHLLLLLGANPCMVPNPSTLTAMTPAARRQSGSWAYARLSECPSMHQSTHTSHLHSSIPHRPASVRAAQGSTASACRARQRSSRYTLGTLLVAELLLNLPAARSSAASQVHSVISFEDDAAGQ